MGLQYDAEGNLIVCDAILGLLMLEKDTNRVVVLASRVSPTSKLDPGALLNFVNGLDIAKGSGHIYFTASQDVPVPRSRAAATTTHGSRSYYDAYAGYLLGLFSGAFAGRLLRYDPATGQTEALLNGLWFANGVALSHDESFVAVGDGNRARILRYYLVGPKAGTTDVLIDNLPGFPDGISRASDGGFWVALVVKVTAVPHLLRVKALRALLAYLPPPPGDRWGAVLKLDSNGQAQRLLLDPDGSKVAFVSAVTEADGRLYLANPVEDYLSYIDLEEVKD